MLTFHVSSPHPLDKRASSRRLYLFHCLLFSIFSRGLNAEGLVYAVTCVHLFYLFLHTSFCTFSHLRIPFFLLPFVRSFLFFNRCDYPPVSFSFHSSQSSRNLRLLTTHIPPYSPRVVVIVLILSTLGWCPLNVIIGKISVFLSTDSQSTGSLTLKSHVPVFALLSPFIAVAVIKWNSSLQVSCILLETSPAMSISRIILSYDWEWAKLSPRVHRIQDGGRPIHRLHRVGSRHLGCRRRDDTRKEF